MTGRGEERLGRRAARGDVRALAQSAVDKSSAGRWRDVTLGELEALGADAWVPLYGEPAARRICASAMAGQPPLPGYVPLPDAWIRLEDGRGGGSEWERMFPGLEPEQGRMRGAQVFLLGAPHHLDLIEVQEDGDGHGQTPVDDPHGRYDDLQRLYETRGYVTVRIPGVDGQFVAVMYPHED